ncbi:MULTISPECIES: response regulator [Desulfococcus]|uniref:Response regulator receiver modulated metal dependent phosphohydrolase n=1 Tax=Desulfococcus multivorans DSM 2059 TaxID=1121405 RepID=S7TQM0_DESML|nr:two-component system response regulator [Desulfococcus multivorans]AOY57563.1 RpfG2: response regulator [Desulfococcus multivorans]AQU99978.1 two-component system response regulator [Desulfococcus multivorans]EPR39261.1 response regulator receiver modulated metal dependent phosphohydrolase [Desulfococcus multivorans DSM 2059]SKA11722.1 putative two-component system response regulator [Desulfococcus multivorans DSM 2059]
MCDISTCTVMIVDDTETNIDILVEALGKDFDLRVAMDGETALEAIADEPPDLILLDIMMPGMDGYEVCRRLKAVPETRDIPIVFLTAMSDEEDEARGLGLGAVDYITKPFSPALVKARVRNQLELKRYRDHLEDLVRERTRQLVLTQDVTIQSMGTLAEYRDPETGGHIRRTQHYVRILAEHLKTHPKFRERLTDTAIELLVKSAPLHDIGKVGVRDNILLKPGELTEAEFEEMKQHTVYGRDAILASEKKLGQDSFLSVAREIAYSHQEKWDGTGYPQGLKGEEIPLFGRLMAVADVYDALISKRVYKPPYPHETAVAMIREGRGTHFDPDVVDAFLDLSDEFRKIALENADFEEERVLLSQ